MTEKTYLNDSFFKESILPKHLNVSTISLSFQMDTIVDIENVAKYIDISDTGICSIDYKGEVRPENYKKKPKKNRKENNFYNSITMEIMTCSGKTINFKIFNNGGVQAAGCKGMLDGNFAINILVNELSREFAIFDEKEEKMREIKFITEPIKISDLKINLINVNFKLLFNINREKLHKILLNLNIPCFYEKCKHAGVKIEFTPSEKKSPVSIFIFESGSIVITGSKNEVHILESYNFLTNLIKTNKIEIRKPTYNELLYSALHSKFGHLMETSLK